MKSKDRTVLYLVTLSVSFGFFTAGVTSGWMVPALEVLRFKQNETGIEIDQNGLTTLPTLTPVGFTVGALTMQILADRLGRRTTILASAVPVALGSILITFTRTAWLLCTGSFIKNIGTGILSSVIGIFYAEIADKDARATLSYISSIMFKLGLLLVTSIGPFLSFQTLNYSVLILPFAYFAACWWIPDTPYFYMKEGNEDAARKSLKKLRADVDSTFIDTELANIKSSVKKETSGTGVMFQSYWELLKGKQYRKALFIAFGLKTAALLTGGTNTRTYLSWIITDTGIKFETKHVLLVYSIISFIVGLMSIFLVDRMGRKTSMTYSFLGTGLALIVVGIYFFLHSVLGIPLDDLSSYASIPLFSIVLVNVLSTMGFESLIHIVPAEIFPLNIKASAMTLLHIFGAILGAFNSKVIGSLFISSDCKNCTSPYAYCAYWMYAFFGFVGALFTHVYVIETKGKELSDIQRELQGKIYDKESSPVGGETELEELRPKGQ